MGSALGSLVVKLALQYAEYTQGLSKSDQEAKKFAKGVQDAMDSAEKATGNFFKGLVAGAAGAVAAYLSVQFAVGQFNKAVSDLADMQGVAEAIGSTAEKVSGLEEPLKRAGMGMNDLQAIGSKLSKALLDAKDPASEAAKAFRSIGVDPKQFTDSTDALVAVSKAMVGFKDDTGKTQVAMQLLGKSGAETIGLMNELAGAQSLGATATLEQIRAADAFSKEVASIGVAFDQISRSVTVGLLPSIHELIAPIKGELQDAARGLSDWFKDNQKQINEVFRAAAQVGGVLWDAVRAIAAAVGGTVAWSVETGVLAKGFQAVRFVLGILADGVTILTAGLIRVGTTVYDAIVTPASGILGMFQKIAEFLGLGLAERIRQTRENMTSMFDGVKSVARNIITDIGAGLTYTNEALGIGPGLIDNVQRLRLEMGGATEAAEGMRKPLRALGKDSDDAAKAAQKLDENFEKLTQNLAEREAQLKAQLVAETKLTDIQKLEVKILADLASGALKVKKGKEEEIKTILKKLLALEKENKELEENEEHIKKTGEENLKAAEALRGKTEALEDQLKAAADEYEQIGLTSSELARLEVARLREAAASLRQKAANLDQNGVLQRQSEEYKRQAELLEKLADQKAANEVKQTQVDLAKAAADAWKNSSEEISNALTDALMRGFESGKGFLRNLIDTAKNLFQTLVLRPIIQYGVTGALSAVGLGAPGGAGANALNAASTGVSLYNNVGALTQLGGNALNYAGYFSGIGSLSTAGYAMAVPGLTSAAAGSQAAMLAAQTAGFGAEGVALTAASGSYATGATVGSGAMAGLAAAAPYIAAVIALVALMSKGGETRSGGQYGIRNGQVEFLEGPSGGDPNMGQTVRAIETAQQSIYDAVASLGGTGGGVITRAGFEMSKYHDRRFSEVFVNGAGRRYYGEQTDFSNEAVAQMFAEDLQRAVLLGVQAADLDKPFAEWFAQFNPFELSGADISSILQTANAVKQMTDAVAIAGGVFTRFSSASVDARLRIVELTGGFEQFTQKFQSYIQNFYSEQEQAAIAAAEISAALREANVYGDWLANREQFRWLVDSIDLQSAAGADQLAGLLNVADKFAGISEYLAEQGLTLGDLAQQVPEGVAAAIERTTANQVNVQQQMNDTANQFQNVMNDFGQWVTSFAESARQFAMATELQARLAQDAARGSETGL